jgi:hypothetical protein
MNRRGLFVLAIPLFGAGPVPFSGRWRSVSVTRGGIGGVYDIDARGTVQYSSAAIVEMPYAIDANQLRINQQSVGFGFHPDGRLQLNFGSNHLEDYTRHGAAPNPAVPLEGEWRGRRLMAGQSLPVIFQFHPGGKAQMVILLKTVKGRVQGDSIAYSDRPASSLRYDATSDKLYIATINGQPYEFIRF